MRVKTITHREVVVALTKEDAEWINRCLPPRDEFTSEWRTDVIVPMAEELARFKGKQK